MNTPISSRGKEQQQAVASTDAEPDSGRRRLWESVTATGLSVIYKPSDSEPILDIVFIHGLKGHPVKTWSTSRAEDAKKDDTKASDGKRLSTKLKDLFARKDASKATSAAPLEEAVDLRVFWPADLLPNECPEARILVFGYDTAIAKRPAAGAVNRNSIFAHSKDLINELGRKHPLTRPILFITHSLGGIVIKEALAICSTSNSEEFEDILKSTAGVIFLGTPHRGSSLADIGEIARKAASVVLMDTNPLILDSLSLRNSDLERCQDTFSSLWQKHKFQVKTFQEGLPMKLPIRLGYSKMIKVVPDVSSCIGDSRERAETLNGNHKTISRFKDANDPNFKKVAGELRRVYSSLLSKEKPVVESSAPSAEASTLPPLLQYDTTHEDYEKLAHFQFKEMTLRQLAINAPADNTCQWISQAPAFETWVERNGVDVHPGLLQIIGKPGSGKSTLMKRMFETAWQLSTRTLDSDGVCAVSYFFNRRGHALEHSVKGMLHAILYQIGSFFPASLQALEAHTEAGLSWLEKSHPSSYLDILKAALVRIMTSTDLAPPRTIIFIDALDECDLSDAADVGYFFAELTKSSHNAGVKLDVCISRREFPHVTVRNCLEIHMEEYNQEDIRQYVRQKLGITNITAQHTDALEDTLATRSNGIFLWVVLAVDGILKDVEAGKNSKYILQRTKSLPKALEDLFCQMLEQMSPEDIGLALRLFQWAVLATERLRIREWHHILAFLRQVPPISLKEWKDSDYYTETDTQLERQIRTLSQGLVEVKASVSDMTDWTGEAGSLLAGAGSLDSTAGDSRIIQPIHETVTEFFVSGRANRLLQQGTEYNFAGEGHLAIMNTCLDYISVSEFDELAAARKLRLEDEMLDYNSIFSLDDDMPKPEGQPLKRLPEKGSSISLRRRHSATSFMSSASAHSAKYRHQDEEEERPKSVDDESHLSSTSSEDDDSDVDVDETRLVDIPPLPEYCPTQNTHHLISPSWPKSFATLFPSLQPCMIRHDDSDVDGNMGLRVDVETTGPDKSVSQLFYLRMHDLSRRKFSFRRYSRDSGREVCCSEWKYASASKSKRLDEAPLEPSDFNFRRHSRLIQSKNVQSATTNLQPTNVIQLDFSNYSMVQVHCHGRALEQKWYFEYWGRRYKWIRRRSITLESFTVYELYSGSDKLAWIIPTIRLQSVAVADEEAGGWIPPCSFQLLDERVLSNETDLADVIIATGLIAVVDDCIRGKWGSPKMTRRSGSKKEIEEPPLTIPNLVSGHWSLSQSFPELGIALQSAAQPTTVSINDFDPVETLDRLAQTQQENLIGLLEEYNVTQDDAKDSEKGSLDNHGTPLKLDLEGERVSEARDAKPQTLDEYPALASYALNRAFVHARASSELGVDPTEILRKLIMLDRGSRWYLLQEGVTGIKTCQDLLKHQELASWVDLLLDDLMKGGELGLDALKRLVEAD